MATKKRVLGWFFFDWASQPYFTLCMTFVFGPYFARILTDRLVGEGLAQEAAAAQAQSTWSFGLTIGGLLIAFSAPLLGAMADAAGRRLPWVWFFSVLYLAGAAGLWFALPDASNYQMALLFFIIGFVAAEFATIFTNSLLPGLGDEHEIGAISGTGFAFGYLGGVIALFIMLLFFVDTGGATFIGLQPLFGLDPAASEGTRFVGPFVAIWYAVFMIPFFLWVREVPPVGVPQTTVSKALSDLAATLKSLKGRVSLTAYLGSSLFYRDALNGIFGFGGVYATLVLDWSITQIGIFGIVGALSATIASWIGGRVDRKRGPKPVIVWSIWFLIGVCAIIVGMSREAIFGIPFAEGSSTPDIIFFVCGAVIGAAGGTIQASSRTMMVLHADPDRPAEAFGLYALSGKATAFLAPALIGIATLISGSPRLGVSPLILLFLIGLVLLIWVKPGGERSTG